MSQFRSSIQYQNRIDIGRKHTVILSHRWALSIANPLSWPPARKSNNLQKFHYLCASKAIWPLQGKSFSITHHILHVSSFIHSINIDCAPIGRLAEKQCPLLKKQAGEEITCLTWLSVCFLGGILKQDIACHDLSLVMKLIVLEGFLAQACFQGLAFNYLYPVWSVPCGRTGSTATQWSVDYKWAYRTLEGPSIPPLPPHPHTPAWLVV